MKPGDLVQLTHTMTFADGNSAKAGERFRVVREFETNAGPRLQLSGRMMIAQVRLSDVERLT